MPESTTRRAAERDKHQGRSASTQAGEYVHEEIEHVRQGRHGVKNTKQAIAIGLSKARHDRVEVKPSKKAPERVKKKAAQESAHAGKPPSKTRSRGAKKGLKQASKKTTASKTVGKRALSAHAKAAASKRSTRSRSAAAKKAAHTRRQSAA